jgi:hypothetical protein
MPGRAGLESCARDRTPQTQAEAADLRKTLQLDQVADPPLIHEARLGGGLYRTLEMMQRNFWKTIEADGNDRCSDTDRGIADHIAMFP